MIIGFYLITIVAVLVLLGYGLYAAAPTVWGLLVGFWTWWTSLPIEQEIVSPIAALIGSPLLGGQVGALWNPWLAAAAIGLGVVVLGAAVRYLPRYISGDL